MKTITWIANITGKGYSPCEVSITGPSTSDSARAALRAQYPGAKVFNVREDSSVREEKFREKLEKSGAFSGGSSAQTVSSSSSNDDGEGFSLDFGSGLAIGGLLLGGVSIWFVWLLLPVATMFGGLIAGYKYSSKYTVNVNFHLRMWLVLGAAILSATGGYMAGDKIHELAGIDYKTGAPTNVISE